MKFSIWAALLFYSSLGFSKCFSWKYQAPNICASVKLVNLLREEQDRCYYEGDVESYKQLKPNLDQLKDFEASLAKRRRYRLQMPLDFCSVSKVGTVVTGIIKGQCYDNHGYTFFGLEVLIAKLFRSEKIEPDFILLKSTTVESEQAGKFVSQTEQCSGLFLDK